MTDTNEKKTLVYQSVFADIIRRQYSHQSIITEKMLIDKYNLSKSPVREALIQLCSDGILESLPRIGYRIIPLSMKDLSDALTLRLLIETKALEYSFPNINENKINTLKIYLSYFKWKNYIYAERYYKNEKYYMKIARKNVIIFSKQNQFM